jgi:hypothetical protein
LDDWQDMVPGSCVPNVAVGLAASYDLEMLLFSHVAIQSPPDRGIWMAAQEIHVLGRGMLPLLFYPSALASASTVKEGTDLVISRMQPSVDARSRLGTLI